MEQPDKGLLGEKEAPSSTTKYGYGVLFVFSVASVIVGSVRGINLATVILLVCVVIAFMLALLAFDRIARSREPTWKLIGTILSVIALSAIVALFVAVLIFLTTGHPEFLGRILGVKEVLSNQDVTFRDDFEEMRSSISDGDFYRMTMEGCFPMESDHFEVPNLPAPVKRSLLFKNVGYPDDYLPQKNIDQGERVPTILVMGFTEVIGTREYDLALGERRAIAVKQALVKWGYPGSRIETVSYGKERGTDVFGPYFCGAIACRLDVDDESCSLPASFKKYLEQYGDKG